MIGLSVVMEILFSVLVIQLYTIVKVPQHEHDPCIVLYIIISQ